MSYGDYQHEIYWSALNGVISKLPTDFKSLLARAAAAMSPDLLNYVTGGCGDEHTQDRNALAFQHWGMIPRMMVDTRERDLSVELFGLTLPSPLFMAPVGVTGIATQDGHGDLAAARAAQRTGIPFIASTLGNDRLEDVAAEAGDTPFFFQLYTPKNKALAESLISRSEKAGYKAIVVTLDTWTTGWRPRDLNAGNFPQLRGHVMTNYFTDPEFRKLLAKSPEEDVAAAVRAWSSVFGMVLTWDDIAWLRASTSLPLVLKGICHPDDARRAGDHGVDAVYCSNHGGRQANGGIAAIDMLPGVVAASGNIPVLFDSGIRSGSDMVKALALGATAVGVGRPYIYGLALDGAAGAEHVLRCILAEADLMMAVNGWPSIADVRKAGAQRC
ncbi:MAG: lactate 2-monooxygenase [Rhizobium sp.]|nr:MAG: lactate 2-monooxygenase [Rhizobium sp.]